MRLEPSLAWLPPEIARRVGALKRPPGRRSRQRISTIAGRYGRRHPNVFGGRRPRHLEWLTQVDGFNTSILQAWYRWTAGSGGCVC